MDSESLYKAFDVWERGGRGWRRWDYAVELEPPFSRFSPAIGHAQRFGDDARVGGGVSGFLTRNRISGDENVRLLSRGVEKVEDDGLQPSPFYRETKATELQIVLPCELDTNPGMCEQFLLSIAFTKAPISFEMIADSARISLQVSCDPSGDAYLKNQLKAFFPEVQIIERDIERGGYLASQFDTALPTAIADFGLAKSFILPLSQYRSFHPDPIGGLIASMETLNDTEKAVFQVLFQPVKGDWVGELNKIQSGINAKPLHERYKNFPAGLKAKLSSPLFAASVRVMVQAKDVKRSWELIRQIGGNLRAFNDPAGNELIALSNDNYPENDHKLSILSRTNYRSGMLLNTSELASLVHLPSSSITVGKLHRSRTVTKALPTIAMGNRLVIGENAHDGKTNQVTLSNEQRTRHVHIIGTTGSGKTTLLLRSIIQDIEHGEGGVCVIDPHGDLIDSVCANVPNSRLKDVILFDPSDSEYPIGLNILQAHNDLEKTLISSDLVAAFKRMSTSWGDVMDAVFANAVLAILESERGGTLQDLKRFLIERPFREALLQTVRDESIRYFWQNEFPLIAGKPHASIIIRLDTFLRQRMIRNTVCQKSSKLNFREIMDSGKILLVKISQGILGVENSHLLGSLFVTKLHQIALSRQNTTERPFFAIYIDEFQNLIVPSLEASLSGNRKFNIGLTLSHQEWRQIQSRSQEVAASVMANCYTRICFRLGDADAKLFANGFSSFDADALQNLGIGEAVARIERSNYDFNLKTFPLPSVNPELAQSRKEKIIEQTRSTYASRPSPESKPEIVQTINTPIESVPPATQREPAPNPNQPLIAEPVQVQKASRENVGRAGRHHQEIQALIKRVAEMNGFTASIEHVLADGGRVDVSMEKGSLRIACEVSVTTTDYEVSNVMKCLAVGYDFVLVVVSNQKKLPLINSKIQSGIPAQHLGRVIAFGLTGLLGFLREIAMPNQPNKKKGDKPAGQRLDFADACEFFGVTSSTLYRWVREGRVPFYRPGREYQFDRDELVLIGKQDLSAKRKASVKLSPLTIDKKSSKVKKDQDSRYRKLLKLD
jgi:excisionase family DNA binding protein